MTCSGQLGKRCSCGKYHELPVTMHERPSMLASKWAWALTALLWIVLRVAWGLWTQP